MMLTIISCYFLPTLVISQFLTLAVSTCQFLNSQLGLRRLANGAFVFFILFFFNLFESFFFCINEAWPLFFLQFIAYRLMGLFGDIFEDERYYIFDKMDFCEVCKKYVWEGRGRGSKKPTGAVNWTGIIMKAGTSRPEKIVARLEWLRFTKFDFLWGWWHSL